MLVISEKAINGLKGEFEIPSDKSISHRSAIFSSLCKGKVEISNFSKGADCHSTLNIIKNLGCDVEFKSEQNLIINSQNALKMPDCKLDCGNSGTSMRLFAGLLAGQNFSSELVGDSSLSKRPMKRVIGPLELMGAKIFHNDFKAPLKITASKLHSVDYNSKLASAQVKSCIMLAGLFADGITKFTEPYKSRNHSELMLKYLGANVEVQNNSVLIQKSELVPKNISVCGDISSAAFFIVAALIVPDSQIIIKNVGVNETRAGILEVAKKMGADIELLDLREVCGEKVADLKIKTSELRAVEISGEIIPRLIDEIPVITLLATQAEGTTVIKDAGDLRNKEADRIKCVVSEMKKIGADIEETEDGFIINGKTKLKGGVEVDCFHDHRLAMTYYIAGLISQNAVSVKDFEWVNISFPEFEELINKIKR